MNGDDETSLGSQAIAKINIVVKLRNVLTFFNNFPSIGKLLKR